jgi:outer membrane immunogenic protein
MIKKIALATTALIIGTVSASAADMAAKARPMAAPIAPITNWTGLFIGIEGGGGWGRSDWTYVGPLTFTNRDIDGALAGGVIGYNWQAPGSNFVIGVEGNLNWADINGSALCPNPAFACSSRLDSLFTATGRLGYAWNSLLLYVKGGAAWTHEKYETTVVGTGALFSSASNDRVGYTVGAGLEYMFAPNWSAKVEYDYADFGTKRMQLVTPAGVLDTPPGTDVRLDLHTVKAGINYHFNWGGPVVARY